MVQIYVNKKNLLLMWKTRLKSEVKIQRIWIHFFCLLTLRCWSGCFGPKTQASLCVEAHSWAPVRKWMSLLLSLSLALTEGWGQTGEKIEQHLISKGGTTSTPRQPQVFLEEASKQGVQLDWVKSLRGVTLIPEEQKGRGCSLESPGVLLSLLWDPLSGRCRQIRLPLQSEIAYLSKFQSSTVRE